MNKNNIFYGNTNKVLFKILVASSLTLTVSPVLAKDSSVVEKTSSAVAKDSYAPLGLRVGSFMVSPSVEGVTEWNDNIYYRQNNAIGDFIFHIKPTVNVRSNWNRHELSFSSGGDFMFYKNHSTEDKQNYFANLGGRFDVLKDSFATANLYFNHMAENRGTPDPVVNVATRPLENNTFGATVGYEHKINRVRINLSDDIKRIDYIDGIDAKGDIVPNSQRTRTVNTSTVRLGYELFSGYEAYLKGSYNFVDYQNPFTAIIYTGNGIALDRSSHGYAVETGLKFDVTHTMVGDAYVGYREQTYKSPMLMPISGMTGGLGLTWLPTRLTTVKIVLNRDILETTQIGLSGFFSTAVTASVDHELLRNVLLNTHASYTNNAYTGPHALNRQDDLYNAGAGIKYLVNRYLYLKLNYDYFARSSNINGQNYDINSAYFTVGTQL